MKKEKLEEILEAIGNLEDLLDDRIVDLYQVKGAQSQRHCFVLYRDKLWEIKEKVEKL